MRTLALTALILAGAGCTSAGGDSDTRASAQQTADNAVKTVASVDLQRYAGMWYEIANYPMVFQRQCVGDTVAHYQPRPDGRIDVLNRCATQGGDIAQADGIASVVPGSSQAKLKVSFFWPFKGDYWIIGLDPDYRWSVVGTPTRKYLWILARTPSLPKADLDRALAAARAQGYDLKPLQYTPQSKATP